MTLYTYSCHSTYHLSTIHCLSVSFLCAFFEGRNFFISVSLVLNTALTASPYFHQSVKYIGMWFVSLYFYFPQNTVSFFGIRSIPCLFWSLSVFLYHLMNNTRKIIWLEWTSLSFHFLLATVLCVPCMSYITPHRFCSNFWWISCRFYREGNEVQGDWITWTGHSWSTKTWMSIFWFQIPCSSTRTTSYDAKNEESALTFEI